MSSLINLLPAAMYRNLMSNLAFEGYLRLYFDNINNININPELRTSGRKIALPDFKSYRLPLTIMTILENYEDGNDLNTKKFKIARILASNQYVNYILDDENILRVCLINDDTSITIIFPGIVPVSTRDMFIGTYGLLSLNTTKEFRHNSKVKVNPFAELKYDMIRDKLLNTLAEITKSMGDIEPEINIFNHSIGLLYSICIIVDNDFKYTNINLTSINPLPYLWYETITNIKDIILSKTKSINSITEILDNYRIILAGRINDSVDSFADNIIFFSGNKILVNPNSKTYLKELRYILEDRSIFNILNNNNNLSSDFHSISNLLNKLLRRKPVIS